MLCMRKCEQKPQKTADKFIRLMIKLSNKKYNHREIDQVNDKREMRGFEQQEAYHEFLNSSSLVLNSTNCFSIKEETKGMDDCGRNVFVREGNDDEKQRKMVMVREGFDQIAVREMVSVKKISQLKCFATRGREL